MVNKWYLCVTRNVLSSHGSFGLILCLEFINFRGFDNLASILFYFRFSGNKPRNLGNNTKLIEWLPQNDLLGEYP